MTSIPCAIRSGCRPSTIANPLVESASSAGAHRNYVAAIANGDGHVRHALMGLELRHRTLQQLDQLALGAFQLAANLAQLAGCVVTDLAFLIDRARDGIFEPFVGHERLYLLGQHRDRDPAGSLGTQRLPRRARALQQPPQNEKIQCSERCAFHTQSRQRGARVGNPVESPWIVGAEEAPHRGHARVLPLDRVPIGCRPKLTHARGAEWRRRPLGDERESAGKLDDVECVRIHPV